MATTTSCSVIVDTGHLGLSASTHIMLHLVNSQKSQDLSRAKVISSPVLWILGAESLSAFGYGGSLNEVAHSTSEPGS